jgi:hypothetical protein
MKKVFIDSPSWENAEYFMIETAEDLNDYADYLGNLVEKKTLELLRSDVPVDKWDHLVTKHDEGGILMTSLMRCRFSEIPLNPLLLLGAVAQEKIKRMERYLFEERVILINNAGGYCFLTPDMIVKEKKEFVVDSYYSIKKDTTYINIENDPELEEYAKGYLSDVDENYSYITNLSKHTEEELTSIFKEFTDAGGTVLYVYTTGLNTYQMYEYSRAAIIAGIKEFEFEFTSEFNPEINNFFSWLKKYPLTYKILD